MLCSVGPELRAERLTFTCALNQFVVIEHLLCALHCGRPCRHTVGKTRKSLPSFWAGGHTISTCR